MIRALEQMPDVHSVGYVGMRPNKKDGKQLELYGLNKAALRNIRNTNASLFLQMVEKLLNP